MEKKNCICSKPRPKHIIVSDITKTDKGIIVILVPPYLIDGENENANIT